MLLSYLFQITTQSLGSGRSFFLSALVPKKCDCGVLAEKKGIYTRINATIALYIQMINLTIINSIKYFSTF